jgi:hypothetical protein
MSVNPTVELTDPAGLAAGVLTCASAIRQQAAREIASNDFLSMIIDF